MTEAAIPPAVVAEAAAAAKAWLRAAGDGDDAAIAALCATAIRLAEAFCGRTLVARPCRQTLAASGAWAALAARPVAAIGAVGRDGAGLAPASYAIDIDADGVGWVRAAAGAPVEVDYLAGEAGGWADIPPPIAQGIAMLVAHLFDDRDGAAAPPAAVAALWRPWRTLRLAAERHS